MTKQQWLRLRREAWDSMRGCQCRPLVKHGGKIVRLRKSDMCTKKIMRCEGRIAAWKRALAKLGEEPGAAYVPSKDQP